MSQYTATQICTRARAIAKVPGFSTQSGIYLNLVLTDLWLHRDLKVNRVTQTITASSGSNGPFALESNYTRTYDLFYSVNGLPFFLSPISMENYDREFKSPSVANYPYEYATDLSTQAQTASGTAGYLYIYPQSTSQLSLTHRYMIQQPDITTPESSSTVPWFSDQDYLIHATATRLMKETDDARYERFVKDGEDMLRTHLIIGDGDDQKVVKEVRLDPRRFHARVSVKLTKNQPL